MTLIQFLIICPLVFLGGFVDAVAGGGGLISLPAYMIAGVPVHMAIGTNKLSSGMGTALTTFRYARNGYIDWKRGGWCLIWALLGSNTGAHLTLLVPENIFKIVMLFILPMTVFYVLRTKVLDSGKEAFSPRRTTVIACGAAFAIGMYDGFYGPGTGTFLILLLTGAAHMKLSEANGITKVINLTTNLTSLCVFILNGKVIFSLGLVAGLFGICGNYFGSKYFDKGGNKAVKPIMLTVLVIFLIKIVYEMIKG